MKFTRKAIEDAMKGISIALQLFISENTIKVHLKKIYAKTGVHSENGFERISPMR